MMIQLFAEVKMSAQGRAALALEEGQAETCTLCSETGQTCQWIRYRFLLSIVVVKADLCGICPAPPPL